MAPRTMANLRGVNICRRCCSSRSESPRHLPVNASYRLGSDDAEGVSVLHGPRSKQVLPHQADFGPLAEAPPESEIQAGMTRNTPARQACGVVQRLIELHAP